MTDNTITVTEAERDHAVNALEILVQAAQMGLVGLTPTTLNGTRVLALCVDPQDGKGPAPVALVITGELFNLLDEPQGKVVLEDSEEGVA